jgi:ferrous iron transport protein A
MQYLDPRKQLGVLEGPLSERLPEVKAMGFWRAILFLPAVCNPDGFGRILNYDQTGPVFGSRPPFGRNMGARKVNVLSDLSVGESGVLVALDLPETVQNHLMHMGFVPDAEVTAVRRAPAGDPTVYSIDGLEIALRHETAEAIRVRPVSQSTMATQAATTQETELAEVAR